MKKLGLVVLGVLIGAGSVLIALEMSHRTENRIDERIRLGAWDEAIRFVKEYYGESVSGSRLEEAWQGDRPTLPYEQANRHVIANRADVADGYTYQADVSGVRVYDIMISSLKVEFGEGTIIYCDAVCRVLYCKYVDTQEAVWETILCALLTIDGVVVPEPYIRTRWQHFLTQTIDELTSEHISGRFDQPAGYFDSLRFEQFVEERDREISAYRFAQDFLEYELDVHNNGSYRPSDVSPIDVDEPLQSVQEALAIYGYVVQLDDIINYRTLNVVIGMDEHQTRSLVVLEVFETSEDGQLRVVYTKPDFEE